MRIAWFTPFGTRSAIGDYSEAIVRGLSRTDDVTIFVSGAAGPEPMRESELRCASAPIDPEPAFLESLDGFDLLVYNMGNHLENHLPIYQTAIRKPGIVILHDLVLRDFFRRYFTLHLRTPESYRLYLGVAHGSEAEQFGRSDEAGDDCRRLAAPLFSPALQRALGAIVHSDYARRRVADEVSLPVRAIDFPLFGPCEITATTRLPKRSTTDGRVRILAFGMLNANKLILDIIVAIAGSERLRTACRFDVIGQGSDDYEATLARAIADAGLDSTVRLVGWQNDERLRTALAAADIVVNLRNPHTGESSASLITSLLAGVATVVWDHGSYSEVPDDAVVKIRSSDEIAGTLERLVGDERERIAYGERARLHALARFDTRLYCEKFREFARDVLHRKPMLALADTAAQVLAEMGASHEIDDLAMRIGKIVAEFEPASALG